ncbi:hypothetical protein [Bacillus altitudinis]|uniref:hypothetical protein n=1 Tax=Bacillus altitudinis TaxID=293387 RepID=UPI0005440A0A|nr:hypothetical protein [Bacillus altitudinis]KWZ68171.1 hypothetical protein HQ51_0205545 [Bacillus altitudinis]
MKLESQNISEAIIRNWGLPEALLSHNEDIEFRFSDVGMKESISKGYHINGMSCKFCLYNVREDKPLFSMDFHEKFSSAERLIKTCDAQKNRPLMLQLIHVHDGSLRKNGIATFYIEKLIEYAISIKSDHIIVNKVNADSPDFKSDRVNALDQNKLEKFYKKFDTPEMPIKLN